MKVGASHERVPPNVYAFCGKLAHRLNAAAHTPNSPEVTPWHPCETSDVMICACQILEPGPGPRTRVVTFAGGFSKWQDYANIRTLVRLVRVPTNVWQRRKS